MAEFLNVENKHPFHNFLQSFEEFEFALFWSIYWGLTFVSFVLGLILITRYYRFSLDNLQDKKNHLKNKVSYRLYSFNEEQLFNYKIQLQKNYTEISNSQVVRLLGSIAALFTFLQIINGRFEISTAKFFELVSFFIVTLPLLTFSFRAFFRYTVFATLSDQIRWIKNDDLNKTLEINPDLNEYDIMVILHYADCYRTSGKLGNDEIKLFGVFHHNWFWARGKRRWGYLLCISLSFFSIIILLFILNQP